MSLFPVVQIVYWLALATWFGGVLFIAVAAPVIFRTIREQRPLLPTVLSVNLENQHADLLAGSVVANLLEILSRVELVCAGGTLVGLAGQWFLAEKGGSALLAQIIIRTVLYIAATVLVIYDWRIVWPRISKYRQEYIEHADEPDVATRAKEQFDRYHRESVNLLMVVLLLLLGLVLFSANIRPTMTLTRVSGWSGS